MKFKYVGTSGVRKIKQYEWNAENKFVQDVKEPELIENLLSYPDGSFVEVKEEPKRGKKTSASDKE